MNAFETMMRIIEELDQHKFHYRISCYDSSYNCIMLEVAIPGERWEIEIDKSGMVFIEKFYSSGEIFNEHELQQLWQKDNL